MATEDTHNNTPPSTDPDPIESLLAELDRSWTEDRAAALLHRLPGPDSPQRRPALLSVLHIDLRERWKRGQRPLIEEYLHRYPELGGVATVPFELLRAEFAARWQAGDTKMVNDLPRRFPSQWSALCSQWQPDVNPVDMPSDERPTRKLPRPDEPPSAGAPPSAG